MSLHTTPLLYLNMGGEMLYVLQQRLRAQKIDSRKSAQVLDDIISSLLYPKVVSTVFEPAPPTGIHSIQCTLECVALSSIMRLDKESMNKLFDLMTMVVKYQLTVATGPREVILLTLNHIDSMRNMVTDESAHECISLVHQMMVDLYGNMTMGQVWQVRNACLMELEGYKVRISVLLRLGLQNDDTTFNFKEPKYNEHYIEHQDMLKDFKLNDRDGDKCNVGSFDLFGNRATELGRDIYSPSYGPTEKLEKNDQRFLRDSGTKAELRLLATQLGTEESSLERTFTLKLFMDDKDERLHVKANKNDDLKSSNSDLSMSGKDEVIKSNEEYKNQLDDTYTDFFGDDNTDMERSMDLLELLDEIE